MYSEDSVYSENRGPVCSVHSSEKWPLDRGVEGHRPEGLMQHGRFSAHSRYRP